MDEMCIRDRITILKFKIWLFKKKPVHSNIITYHKSYEIYCRIYCRTKNLQILILSSPSSQYAKIKHSKKYNPENEYSSQCGTKINLLSGPSCKPATFSVKAVWTSFMFKVNLFNLIKIKNHLVRTYLLLRACLNLCLPRRHND